MLFGDGFIKVGSPLVMYPTVGSALPEFLHIDVM
jgi:hypothetical protein